MFVFYRDELQIGGIFIRIYNEMPTFPITNCKLFVIDLLEYLKQGYTFLMSQRHQQINYQKNNMQILQPTLAANHPGHNLQKNQPSKATNFENVLSEYNRSKTRNNKLETVVTEQNSSGISYNFEANENAIEHIIMVLKSLISVIKSNANVEIQCIGHFEMLFGFLSTTLCSRDCELKTLALEIVSLVSRNKDCVNEIAACEILGHFLVAMRDPELKDVKDRVLETLSGLLNVQKMVKEAQAKGAVIYLLELFANSRNPQIREHCAEILGKMTADKLTGPKVNKGI